MKDHQKIFFAETFIKLLHKQSKCLFHVEMYLGYTATDKLRDHSEFFI